MLQRLALLLALAAPSGALAHGTPQCSLSPLDAVWEFWREAAICQNATPSTVFSTPTSNAAAAACITGSNTQKGVLDFDQTTAESVQFSLRAPDDWSGVVDVDYKWLSGTGSTNPVVWCSQIICRADGETDDTAFPAVSSDNCVSDAGKASANQLNDASDTNVSTSGCAAGELIHVRISRDPAEVSTLTDTHAADARLVGVLITLYRQ